MADEIQDPETAEMDESGNEGNPNPNGDRGNDGRNRPQPKDVEELAAELNRAREALKKSNQENASRRHKLEEYERAEEERKQSQMSDMDKLRKQASDASKRVQDAEARAEQAQAALERERINNAVEREAQRMGWDYPDIAPNLIDRERVTFNPETGKIEGVQKELERIVKDKPGLVTAGRGGGTPPREGPRRNGGGNPAREQRGPTLHEELRSTGNYV